MVNINSLERDGLRQAELCPRHTMVMNTRNNLIPDRSQPGITMTAPTVRHRDVGDKYATGVPKIKKIRRRENIERKKKKRQTEEEVGRQYQRVDRNGLCQLN